MRRGIIIATLLALPLMIAIFDGRAGSPATRSIPAASVPLSSPIPPAAGVDVQRRITADLQRGEPLVVHLVVALCDNRYQGIVPVPERIGNGQDPESNLYWGAAYGVRTYLTGKGGWKLVQTSSPGGGVLQRVVLSREIRRDGALHDAYLIADAWDGKEIRGATEKFLKIAAGEDVEKILVTGSDSLHPVVVGGGAHLVGYVGHNGLMDFQLGDIPRGSASAPPRSSLVLACASKSYFAEHLRAGGSHPLLMTTGLMAPEAYVVDAAIASWLAGKPSGDVREAAAHAYNKFQRCGLKAARNLFFSQP